MFHLLHDTGDWSLGAWICSGDDGGSEVVHRHEVVVPIRGAFLRERSGTEVLASPNRAVLADRGDTYRITHPVSGGDECLVLLVGERSLEDLGRSTGFVVGRSRPRFRHSEAVVSAAAFLTAAGLLRGRARDPLAAEDGAATLLEELFGGMGTASAGGLARTPATLRRHRRAVAAGASFISAHYRSTLTLADIAAAATYSPFHFARVFRRVMGVPPYRYVTRLRLRDAAAQALDGEDNLSALALRVGFRSHSHMTDAFRAEFGRTPSGIRARFR